MSTFSWRVLRLPLLITLLWGLLLFTLFRWTAQREDEYTTDWPAFQTCDALFQHRGYPRLERHNGGVWSANTPAARQPWLPEEERTLAPREARPYHSFVDTLI